MHAVRFHEHGTSSVLRVEEVEVPLPAEGQVRIRVASSAFSSADNGIRAGVLPIPVELPHTPGYDVAGTVDALGQGVSNVAVGDEVIAFLPMTAPGAAAEFVVAPASVVVPAPATVPLVDAAAIPSIALTAWQALFDEGHLSAGQRVLVVGAGGGVGGYAVQFAQRAGAYVVATASPRSESSVRAAGAAEVIDHTATVIGDALAEPVDLLLNLAPISVEELEALVGKVRDGGAVVSTTAWMPAPGDDTRNVRSSLVFVRSDAAQLAEIVALVDAGEIRVETARRVSLTQLASVHEQSAAGTLRGKVVVLPMVE